MRQYRTSGTVQGAPGNRRSYCRQVWPFALKSFVTLVVRNSGYSPTTDFKILRYSGEISMI